MKPNYNFTIVAMGSSPSFSDFSTQHSPQRIINHYNVPLCYIFLKLIAIMKGKVYCILKTSKVASEDYLCSLMKQS